jgi:predicted permease
MGANLAMLQLVNAALFHRLSIRDADSLVQFQPALSFPSIAFYRDHNSAFSYTVAERTEGLFVEDELDAETSTFVPGNYFPALCITPELGRLLDLGDDEAGAALVVILSNAYWQKHFGGDPSVVGRFIRLNGARFQVVGVLHKDFDGLSEARPAFFVPISAHGTLFDGSKMTENFSQRGTVMYAKLKPGVPLAAAEGQLASLTAELQQQHPNQIGSREPPIGRRSNLPREALTILTLVTVLVSLVLMTACANLGNLLLARGHFREQEIRIRLYLGAGPRRILGQLMTENVLLALLGSAAGLVTGSCTAKALLLAGGAPPGMRVVVDWQIVVAAIVIAVVCAILFGLTPALQAVRNTTGHGRAREVLIAVQVTASCFLLIMTSMLARSANQSVLPDVRFDYHHKLVIDPQLYKHNLSGAAARQALDEIGSRIEQNPAVVGVTWSASPLFGDPLPGNDRTGLPAMMYYKVAASYFRMMNASLVRGRLFADGEADVIVLSESAARAFSPKDDAIGKTVVMPPVSSMRMGRERLMQRDRAISLEQRTVIGVVKDSRPGDSAEAYIPIGNDTVSTATLIVDTRDDAAKLIKAIRTEASLPGLVPAAWLMETDVNQKAGPPPGVLLGVGSLAASSTLLAGFGIFGLTAFTVAQQTREIGVRIAIGAGPSHILATLLSKYSRAMGIGAVGGVVLAVIARFLIRTIVVGLNIHDPMNDVVAVAIIGIVVIIAVLIPASRALRIDPAAALRYE